MKTVRYTVSEEAGLHARTAGLLISEAGKYGARITLEAGGKTVLAGDIPAVMGLEVKKGDLLVLRAQGADEEEALEALEKILRENL